MLRIDEERRLNCALRFVLADKVATWEFGGLLKLKIPERQFSAEYAESIFFTESLILAQNERWRRG